MTAIVLFMAGVAAIAGWWLSHQRLMAKPWLEEGALGDLPQQSSLPVAKIGLGVFCVVIGSLFTLVISAYSVRMDLEDWQTVPIPKLLWFNTAVLVLSSIALQLSLVAARRGDREGALTGLLAGGASSVIFLVGQLLAWQQLRTAGFLVAGNPANSFFYLITGLHGLHIAGGLVALGRTTAKAFSDLALPKLRPSIELCAMYWHFLLVIWLILLGLLTGQADEFLKICHQLLG
ncbi:MAG: cytochrome c oxidase subunit 3 [Xanthobacteraceae bacterium]